LSRLGFIDRWRGIAIVMMVGFHACYDSTYFGLTHFNMLGSPFWTTWRTGIVSLFIFISGISLTLAHQAGRSGSRYRIGQLMAGAAAVSLVTAYLFGPRWIYFGVLHFYLVATLITRPLLRWSFWFWLPGLLALWLGQLELVNMDSRWLNWIGMAAHKPATEDYAPLVPWLGLFWLGAWWGQTRWITQCIPPAGFSPWDRGLQWLGRHGLIIYLIHQPILFGLFELHAHWSTN
jgi:Predicted membrane protein